MTGRIPKQFIDDLLARTDIVDVVDARVPLKRAGSNHLACCPFHSEKTPSFTVSQSKQFYHCFGCGAHGTALGFLMEYDRMNFPEAVEELARLAGMEVPKEVTFTGKSEEFAPLYDLLSQVANHYRQQLKKNSPAIEYLKKRGMSGKTALAFGIGFVPSGWDNVLRQFGKTDADKQRLLRTGLLIEKDGGGHYDRFRNRIMFPIRNRRGNVIGFGGRSIDPNDNPKYLNSPETPLFHKGRELYGLYEVQQQRPKENIILVVEGYMDVVMLAEHGVSNAVATLGTATSREHIQTLFKAAQEIVFCFDGDRAGRDAAWRALETALPELDDRHQIKFLFLPQDEDPDSYIRKYGRERFLSLLKSATSLSAYLFDTLKQRFDANTLDGRARLAEEAKSLIGKTQDNLFRQLLLNELSNITNLSLQQLGAGKTANSLQRQPKRQLRNHLQLEMNNMRKAIAALLTKPALAEKSVLPEILRTLNNPGIELLFEMVNICRVEPQLTAGRLVQRYQEDNSPHGTILSKLAAYEFADSSDQAVERELIGALKQLEKEALDAFCQQLLEKKNLSNEQKQQLQSALIKKDLIINELKNT